VAKQPTNAPVLKTAYNRTKLHFVGAWKRMVDLLDLRKSFATPGSPHRAFRITHAKARRPSPGGFGTVWGLIGDSWRFVWSYKRILLGLGAMYAVLAYFLVGGVSQTDFIMLKDATVQVMSGDLGAFGTAVSMFGAALTGNLSTPPSDLQQFVSAFMLLFFWLSVAWATRMLAASKNIKLRDALYNSGAPIIPTLVVLSVIAMQLIPAAIGIFAYATALNGGWLDGGVESMTFAVAAVALSLLSAYFLVSSLTALVVVALSGTYPWQALRFARGLVMGRRWVLVLRILVMIGVTITAWGVVLIPVFMIEQWLKFDWLPLVPISIQALVGLTLVYTSVYVYKLYRSLL
jgi:hypothetical protein